MIRLRIVPFFSIAIALAAIAGCASIHHPHAGAIALPEGVKIEPPGPDVPAAYAAYVGEWERYDIGNKPAMHPPASGQAVEDTTPNHYCVLAIARVDPPLVTAFYDEGWGWIPLDGGFPLAAHGTLVLRTPGDFTFRLRLRSDGKLSGFGGREDVTFTKVAQRATE